MLYTAHWCADNGDCIEKSAPFTKDGCRRGYKCAHKNHPMTMWVRSSPHNYMWAAQLALALAIEHNRRFKTIHSCAPHALWLSEQGFPRTGLCKVESNTAYYATDGFPGCMTRPPECMPPQYHDSNILVAYHKYYKGDKLRFARWKEVH